MNAASILEQYYFPDAVIHIEPLGNGLINHTFLATVNDKKYVWQQINTQVFRHAHNIAHNIQSIGSYLLQKDPDYFFIQPVPALNNSQMIEAGDGTFWRLFPFIEQTYTLDVLEEPVQAYEAAYAFGLFTNKLSAFPTEQLKNTIPQFHDVQFRVQQLQEAIKTGNQERVIFADEALRFLEERFHLVDTCAQQSASGKWVKRVMHHDTKISNVLFDTNNQAVCVIDLDTIMPGYFFSDVGDMMRTYLCPVNEEETNLSCISVRDDFFKAIVTGYTDAMKNSLTTSEKSDFVLAGKLMIFMQAVRFLTDFINNDIYYGAAYELHNYNRALNQIQLLTKVEAKQREWTDWLLNYFS